MVNLDACLPKTSFQKMWFLQSFHTEADSCFSSITFDSGRAADTAGAEEAPICVTQWQTLALMSWTQSCQYKHV